MVVFNKFKMAEVQLTGIKDVDYEGIMFSIPQQIPIPFHLTNYQQNCKLKFHKSTLIFPMFF